MGRQNGSAATLAAFGVIVFATASCASGRQDVRRAQATAADLAAYGSWLGALELGDSLQATAITTETVDGEAFDVLSIKVTPTVAGGWYKRYVKLSALLRERDGVELDELLFYKFALSRSIDRAAVRISGGSTCNVLLRASTSPPMGVQQVRPDQYCLNSSMAAIETVTLPSSVVAAPGAATTAGTAFTIERADAFLRNRFGNRLRPVLQNGNLLQGRVEGVRSLVVRTKQFWENVQVIVILDGQNLTCILDGKYAGGLGNSPPSLEAFQDMEPKYAIQLQDLAKELLQGMKDFNP